MKDRVLRLYSEDLLSKWGFNDGNEPDELLDYWDDLEKPCPEDWHSVLHVLIYVYLIPKVRKSHTVTTYFIDTTHNPVRASSVDGVNVDDTELNGRVKLTPEFVEVPYAKIDEICAQLGRKI